MRSAVAAVCVLATLSGLWYVAEAYVAHAHADIRDGKCFYNSVEIPLNETVNVEDPCQAWACDIERQVVDITGCPYAAAGENCTLKIGEGPYPSCCAKPVCRH